MFITGLGEKAITSIYNPRGSRVPAKKQYSQAESFAARGMYPEAVDLLEMAVSDSPEDPEPYLMLARILRDHLEAHEDSARWLRRARRESSLSVGASVMVTRELIELYRGRLDAPARAVPELARLAEEAAGSPAGEWAARELQDLKRTLAEAEPTS
jgi:hypothetical protein